MWNEQKLNDTERKDERTNGKRRGKAWRRHRMERNEVTRVRVRKFREEIKEK